MTQALHESRPNVKMLWPETDVGPLHTRQYLEAGALPELQIVAPHPYSLHRGNPYPEDQQFIREVPKIRQFLRDSDVSDQIWATEVGYTAYRVREGQKNPHTFYRPCTEHEQAVFLARMHILALGRGMHKVFWHTVHDPFTDPYHPEANFGLMRHVPIEPRPAAIAYANIVHWLERMASFDLCADQQTQCRIAP